MNDINEKDSKVSGGEKQRVAIARVFLKDPKIILRGDGEVVEKGIHEELMNLNKKYAKLYRAQN